MRLGEIIRGSKTALVTGASTGIGRCYAEQLAELGYNLIIVGRDSELLHSLAEHLTTTCGVTVTVHHKDLATLTAAEA